MNPNEFLACGNVMMDIVEQDNSIFTDARIGGPALFALAGMRLFTENCKLVCQMGQDYSDTFGKWLDLNGISRRSVRVSAEYCSQHIIRHHADGTYSWRSRYGSELLGYLKTTPGHIDDASDETTKGIYLAQNTDKVFWRKLNQIKQRKGFKIMWELEPADDNDDSALQKVKDVISCADMWSLNANEASRLFRIPIENEEDLIGEIMKMPVELTLFRVGKKGAYAVTPSEAVFCESINITESVDATGCGNNSTGAAMYAHVTGADPKQVVIMANIAAGYNAGQFGPWPKVSDADMSYAQELMHSYLNKL